MKRPRISLEKYNNKKSSAIDYFPLSDLRPFLLTQRIKVRILRRFHICNLLNDTVNLILVDEKGHKIHAMIAKDLAKRYSRSLIEGNWLYISNFNVIPADQPIRFTTHIYTIQWKISTLISRKLKSYGDDDCFAFETFENVRSGVLPTNMCIDLIGRVMGISIFDKNNPSDSDCGQIYIDLENERHVRLQCRLPNEYTENVLASWNDSLDNIIICIVQFGILETSLDGIRATTAYTCSRVLFNHPCDEDRRLRNIFDNHENK